LEEGLQNLKKYDEMVLVYEKNSTPHPSETVDAVKSFCKKNHISFRLVEHIHKSDIHKGQAWFVIHDADLVQIIKSCRSKGFNLGKDVGVLSYNDTPMKQIVGGGISVISTDFERMGKLAADFVKKKQLIEKVLPTFLILRDSL
jgi:DNA-binding LacI/PurR family transcriptional regulator